VQVIFSVLNLRERLMAALAILAGMRPGPDNCWKLHFLPHLKKSRFGMGDVPGDAPHACDAS